MLKTGCITYSAPLHIASITRARTQTENIIIMKVLCIDDTQLANSAVYREEDLYLSTGCPVCLVLKQGAVNQIFLEVFLMFLACLDHKWWAQFHLGILGPQE